MPDETVTVGDTEVEIRETDDGFEAVEVEDEADPSPRRRVPPVAAVRSRSHLSGSSVTFTDVRGKGDHAFDVAVRVHTSKNVKGDSSLDEYVGGDVQYVRGVDTDGVYDGSGSTEYGIEPPRRSSFDGAQDVIFFVDSGI